MPATHERLSVSSYLRLGQIERDRDRQTETESEERRRDRHNLAVMILVSLTSIHRTLGLLVPE
jgi:hypothetical protein